MHTEGYYRCQGLKDWLFLFSFLFVTSCAFRLSLNLFALVIKYPVSKPRSSVLPFGSPVSFWHTEERNKDNTSQDLNR